MRSGRAMVLLIIVAALFGPLTDALADYAANDTVFGPVLQSIVPILIGVGILLGFVGAFLAFKGEAQSLDVKECATLIIG